MHYFDNIINISGKGVILFLFTNYNMINFNLQEDVSPGDKHRQYGHYE